MRSIFFVTLVIVFAMGLAVGQSAPSDKGSEARSTSAGSAPQASQVSPNVYVRPDAKKRFHRYLMSVVGPTAFGKSAAAAGLSTWRNSPEEWGDKWEGFGRRFASGMGKNLIKGTVVYGLDESLKYDSSYYPSRKRDFGSRLKNALISPVTARDTRGKRVVGLPKIVGTYTASIIAAETWYPARYDLKDGLKSGTVSLGMNAVFGLLKEFVWKK